MHDDGLVRILTLHHTLDTWIAADHQVSFRHSALAEPVASFVLGTKGSMLAADPRALEVALRAQQHGVDKDALAGIDLQSLLITVSATSVSVRLNCVDTVLARAEPHVPAESAKVIRIHHQAALVLFAVDSSITVYALPDLEEIFVHRAPTRLDRYVSPLKIIIKGSMNRLIGLCF
jgi:Lethal giant larvae(Lgl) like, C-terminal